jgi:hypothetical protein
VSAESFVNLSLSVKQADYLLTILDELDDMEQEAHDLRVALSQALNRPVDAPVPDHIATPRRPS